MRTFAVFHETPLVAVHPEGWLRRYLEVQRDGLTGHMEHAGFPFDTPGWSAMHVQNKGGDVWWPFEQTGYWVDGLTRCGYLLRDPALIRRARQPLEFVLRHADKDGYLGPRFMKGPKGWLRWPHAVFFRALMAHYSATGDDRILPALTRHYLSNTAPHSDGRDVCNVEILCWLYGQTGNRRVLRHAVRAFEEFNRLNPKSDCAVVNQLSSRRPTEHGVTYNEMGKLGALLYMATGNRRWLRASRNAYRKIDRFAMLMDGVHSSTEGLKGKDPLDSHETCDIADYTWSCGYLLQATGRAEFADKIERACFNAAPGAVRADFKGLQYFSCPNQVVATATSNHNEFFRGHKWMSYRPNPGTECCPGEVNRILPNYSARQWLRDARGGVVAALYGPSRITLPLGRKGAPVTIVQETQYPFGERIDFEIRAEAPAKFPLVLRIPGWCRGASLELNGQPWKRMLRPGTFVRLERKFAPNDRVTLHLPMKLKLSRWPRGGVGLERGPLVFALRIEEDWRVDPNEAKATKEFPAWNLYPASAWNYALDVDARHLEQQVEVVLRQPTTEPWTLESAPIELRVPARRVRGWKLQRRSQVRSHCLYQDKLQMRTLRGKFVLTPQLPDPAELPARLSRKTERVTLVPYGCTRLRIAVFPSAK
jgi:hypothetical protein